MLVIITPDGVTAGNEDPVAVIVPRPILLTIGVDGRAAIEYSYVRHKGRSLDRFLMDFST